MNSSKNISSQSNNHIKKGTWQQKNPNSNGNDICDDNESSYKGSLAPRPRVIFIERIVELLLNDPEFNIKRLPDSIEKNVYNFVVYIIFDNIVNGVWGLNHVSFIGHITEMEMVYCNLPDHLPMGLEKLDKVAISKLVDAIMKKKLLNLTWLPDAIERNLYYCILLITFTILEILASSMVINIVGHAFRLKFGPNGKGYANVEDKLESILSSEESQKNIDLLVQSMLANPELNNSYIPDFMERSIYKTVYSLILCLIEEIFYDLHIDILGNIIHIHLVPDTWREVTGSSDSSSSSSSNNNMTYKDAVINSKNNTTITTQNADDSANNKNENSTTDDDNGNNDNNKVSKSNRRKHQSSSPSSSSCMIQEIDIIQNSNNTTTGTHHNNYNRNQNIGTSSSSSSSSAANNAVNACATITTAIAVSPTDEGYASGYPHRSIHRLLIYHQYTLIHLLLAFVCGIICTTIYHHHHNWSWSYDSNHKDVHNNGCIM